MFSFLFLADGRTKDLTRTACRCISWMVWLRVRAGFGQRVGDHSGRTVPLATPMLIWSQWANTLQGSGQDGRSQGRRRTSAIMGSQISRFKIDGTKERLKEQSQNRVELLEKRQRDLEGRALYDML